MFLKVRDIASRLGVTKHTVYNWVQSGQLPGAVIVAGIVRVNAETFQKFLDQGGRLAEKHGTKQSA